MPFLIIANRHGSLPVNGHLFKQFGALISDLLDDICIDGDILNLIVVNDPVHLVQMAHHIRGQTWLKLVDAHISRDVIDEVQTHVVVDHGVFESTQTLL